MRVTVHIDCECGQYHYGFDVIEGRSGSSEKCPKCGNIYFMAGRKAGRGAEINITEADERGR